MRTLNPYEANLFYVPAFAYGYLSNGGVPHDFVRRVVRFLKAEYPQFWERFDGADHMFWRAITFHSSTRPRSGSRHAPALAACYKRTAATAPSMMLIGPTS